LFTGVSIRPRSRIRIYINAGFERELATNVLARRLTVAKSVHPTRFPNYNVHGEQAAPTQPATPHATLSIANPSDRNWATFVTNSLGHGLYRGATFGVRKRLSQSYQLEANYVLSKDEDDDSNERDPFTDRSFNFYDLSLDYGPSDRDIRHKFNFFTFAELPGRVTANVRMQGRTAQPITTSPRVLNGVDRGRNWDRKDNAYFSLDWRLQRAFRIASGYQLSPSLEMFNTFNNANNINPLTTPGLQLRRLPPPGRRRPEAASARREGDVLASEIIDRWPRSIVSITSGRRSSAVNSKVRC
jgi:hypothetical protein